MKGVKKALFPLLAIVITIGYLWQTNLAVTPKEASWNDALTEASQGGYRNISTNEFWKRYQEGADELLLVDTRQEWKYRTGHITGALNFPMEPTWMSRWRNKRALEKFLGPDKERYLVFY